MQERSMRQLHLVSVIMCNMLLQNGPENVKSLMLNSSSKNSLQFWN